MNLSSKQDMQTLELKQVLQFYEQGVQSFLSQSKNVLFEHKLYLDTSVDFKSVRMRMSFALSVNAKLRKI